MDKKTAAIVLCAGMGSRLGLPENQNKCAVSIAGTSPAQYMVSALTDAGVDRITVVVGYASESVKKVLSEYTESGRVSFAENSYYDKHGCNYSLACGMADENIAQADRIIIAEGDSLLNRRSISQLAETDAEAASLVRAEKYVDPSRSVIAVGSGGKILRYEYDVCHKGVMPELPEGESVIGDSMQLWMFSGQTLGRLRELLGEYRREADSAERPMLHSGIYSINMLGERIEPVFSDEPDGWINLNTQEDLRKAGDTPWLIR